MRRGDHLSIVRQGITCAATAPRLFHQNTALHQIINIPQGGILRAFGQFGPFGRGQLAFKTVEQPVDDGSLAFIEWLVGMSLPEMGLMEDAGQEMFRAVNGAIKTSPEPFKPGVGYVRKPPFVSQRHRN